MYQAKELGRNTFQFYAEAMPARGPDRLWLRTGLGRAIEQGELEMYFQPEIEIDSDRGRSVYAMEALMRWFHPEHGAISPVDFIPVAEETGLIMDLGAFALRETCRWAAAWRAQGISIGRVAVNVSMRQLHAPTFVRTVEEQLAAAGLPASALTLEITESVLSGNHSEVAHSLTLLKQREVSIALDDFGTGYSSLAHLEDWPIDVIKIDRSFVARLPGDPRSVGIIRAMVGLGQSLGLQVVAEGVETEAQRDVLLAEGCRRMQGYLYARPMPAKDIPAWLAKHNQ
jgi:EAL domain-containing protein (putative c-di-GMP-specific phosphodiesterase class I)